MSGRPLTVIALLAVAAAGCGYKGPLTLPPKTGPVVTRPGPTTPTTPATTTPATPPPSTDGGAAAEGGPTVPPRPEGGGE